MTLGTLKLRLLKQFPGIDLDVLDGFISDRYSEILRELPWSRLTVSAILQTTAPYVTGTIAVTHGSNAVTLTGGAWVLGMTGRSLRVGARDEFYSFTWVNGTSGTLDRSYEGETEAAAGYSIFQRLYALPANCRFLEDDAFVDLDRLSREDLNTIAPARTATGTPRLWVSAFDDASTPPRMQIELYPIPSAAIGLRFQYLAEASTPSGGSSAFLPWMEPATALMEGVIAKIQRTPQFKDLAAAQLATLEAGAALKTMRDNEAHRMQRTQMSLPSHYTSHRRRRYQ